MFTLLFTGGLGAGVFLTGDETYMHSPSLTKPQTKPHDDKGNLAAAYHENLVKKMSHFSVCKNIPEKKSQG